MTLAIAQAPTRDRSSVVGTFTAFADVGFAIGAVSLGAVADAAGYDGVFLASALAALGGLLLLGRLPAPLQPAAAEAS